MSNNANEAVVILSKLGTPVEAGVGSPLALRIVLKDTADLTEHRFSEEFIDERVSQLNSGSAFSSELAKLEIFSEYELAVITAYESGGSLGYGLTALVDEYVLLNSIGA